MKGFIRHLDNHKNMNPSLVEYANLIQQTNINYSVHRVGPTETYNDWQKKYEVLINPPIIPPNPVIKIHKDINISIQTIQDLIKIVDENPLEAEYEYNVDLKALHTIYDELHAINNMVGLNSLKQSIVDQLLYFIQNLHQGVHGDFKHTVLVGPPGTGKTEIAQLMGQMYSKIGVLKNSVFKKATRADLIAGYLGQTALKTQKVIDGCLGGVLFIDEAYSLGSQSDTFSKECIDTLCEALSAHKDKLMVVIAGYEAELKDGFFNMNQGLESRFLWRFTMDPYSAKELKEIFLKKVKDNDWFIDNENEIPDAWFEQRKGQFRQFGRDMENLFTYTKIAHRRRIYGKSFEYRKRISLEDLEKGYQVFLKHKGIKKTFVHDMYS